MTTTSKVAPTVGGQESGPVEDVQTRAQRTAVAPSTAPATKPAARRVEKPADEFMLRLLRIKKVDPIDIEGIKGAHRAFRWAIVFSAIRCTITYLLIPILIPVVSVAGAIATPLSITLCVAAGINGVLGVRRFWKTDHRGKWKYTWFMAFVFLILIGTLIYEITGIVTGR